MKIEKLVGAKTLRTLREAWARTSSRLRAGLKSALSAIGQALEKLARTRMAGRLRSAWERLSPRLRFGLEKALSLVNQTSQKLGRSRLFGRFPKIWNRISTQLHISFGGAVALVITISILTIFVLDHINTVQHDISEKSVPEMQAAFTVAQQTATLVAAAPQLATAVTIQQFEDVSASVSAQERAFEDGLTAMLRKRENDERARKIQVDGAGIIKNIERIKTLVRERFDLRQRTAALTKELHLAHDQLMTILLREIDDQLFYTITGYWDLDDKRARRATHFSEVEFQTYRHLVELREAATLTTQLLATVFTVSDAAMLRPLQENFEATVGLANRSLDALSEHPRHGDLSESFSSMLSIGREEGNGFDLHGRNLAVKEELSSLLRDSQALGVDIVAIVEGIVGEYSLTAQKMAERAAEITRTSSTLLLIINIISITGAILIGWLFVERRLVRRLDAISQQIRSVAGGKLETPIEVSGNDEIGELAKALEVFRQNALEVQRLSLVEQLADELKEMYEDLEQANEKLKSAQDQVVMQEKLAALGQLTAGVAHEIKNPMNFIMNFAQVSKDLLEELLEEVAKNKPGAEATEEYDAELVNEIAQDLTGNLGRIQEHGERANRIVMDMLKMGRHDSGDWQPTDISALLHQHAMLAFHSSRAADPDFQLEIQEDYAKDVEKLLVKPQNLGRVFLNLVTNACYATDEKRKALVAEDKDRAKAYWPRLQLSTKVVEGFLEVHVRDNGNGIPESALKKIFDPFFTTKPPDKGTGLGLSLSSDIIREHGGELRVDTKEGEHTDMIVSLPLKPPENLSTNASKADSGTPESDTNATKEDASPKSA